MSAIGSWCSLSGVAKEEAPEVLSVDGREVRITHPSKPYFSREARLSKLDLVRYYLSVAEGALAGIRDRPIVLKRFVNGAEGEAFYQKRAPEKRPDWLRTVTLSFPSGRTAEEVVVDDAAGLAWIVNLGCIELHPHPVRSGDLEHPDELRVDLDPRPGVAWADVRRVALEVKALLDELGLRGWPKTSGSRGMHVNVRIAPRWTFGEVRRAALALSREIERRAPALATSKWWKEERHGVFLDYNQNAKDRTTCSAYSVRPLPDARVSTPLAWEEVPDCEPADFTTRTVPQRFAALGDPHAGIDAAAGGARGAARARGAGRGGRSRRRAVAAALPQDGGRGAPRRAVAAQASRTAPQRRCRSSSWRTPRAGRRHSRGSSAGRRGIRGRREAGGGRRARRLDARPIVYLDEDPREPPERPGGPAPAAGDARPGRRPHARMASPAAARGHRRVTAQRPVAKIADSSCGATTSS